jgi:methylmalonyl-CoA carboxyltransferase large subunit
MRPESADGTQLASALEALRAEVARLSERVAVLEGRSGEPSRTEPASAPAPAAATEEPLSEELILVIGAAVAAFLGKKAHVRQIRLVGTAAWAQQGRLTIQASHDFGAQHGRS